MFDSLDFLYVPAPDIEASIHYYKDVLGCKLKWKIHAFGVWVACVKTSPRRPYVLLADHVKHGDMTMIYRVENLKSAARELGARGWHHELSLEIPP